jgi:hypothetical protein
VERGFGDEGRSLDDECVHGWTIGLRPGPCKTPECALIEGDAPRGCPACVAGVTFRRHIDAFRGAPVARPRAERASPGVSRAHILIASTPTRIAPPSRVDGRSDWEEHAAWRSTDAF